ncbi:unnamed protein product [Linum tenue]|uniref:NAC-A/B domain-containing protein n=1 Tax=Linum tenue TaxID=586396 RepID=A0AAV0IJF6_9ROSI|nr:unnamed protein product [Linum tenue]
MFVPRQVVLAKNQLSQSKQLTADGRIELRDDETCSSALAGKIDKLLESHAKVVTKLDNLLETLTRDRREARIEKSIEALRQTLVEILGRLTTGTGRPSAAAAVDATSDPRDIDLVTSHGSSEQSRSEKQSRKAMLKLGMEPITGVCRVTFKTTKNILFFISKPDVFKSPSSDTYVIFGEAKIENLSYQLQRLSYPAAVATAVDGDDDEEDDEDEDAEEVDEIGIDPRDIDLIMTQVGVPRAMACKALKTHRGDIVSAIMELTT